MTDKEQEYESIKDWYRDISYLKWPVIILSAAIAGLVGFLTISALI